LIRELAQWTLTQRIRTAAKVSIRTAIAETAEPPAYHAIAARARHLRALGMRDRAIAPALGVSDKTVAKAIRPQERSRREREYSRSP